MTNPNKPGAEGPLSSQDNEQLTKSEADWLTGVLDEAAAELEAAVDTDGGEGTGVGEVLVGVTFEDDDEIFEEFFASFDDDGESIEIPEPTIAEEENDFFDWQFFNPGAEGEKPTFKINGKSWKLENEATDNRIRAAWGNGGDEGRTALRAMIKEITGLDNDEQIEAAAYELEAGLRLRSVDDSDSVLVVTSGDSALDKKLEGIDFRDFAEKYFALNDDVRNQTLLIEDFYEEHGITTEAERIEFVNRVLKAGGTKAEASVVAEPPDEAPAGGEEAKKAADKAEAEKKAKEEADKAEAEKKAKEEADKAEAEKKAKEEAIAPVTEDPERAEFEEKFASLKALANSIRAELPLVELGAITEKIGIERFKKVVWPKIVTTLAVIGLVVGSTILWPVSPALATIFTTSGIGGGGYHHLRRYLSGERADSNLKYAQGQSKAMEAVIALEEKIGEGIKFISKDARDKLYKSLENTKKRLEKQGVTIPAAT